MFDPSHVFLWYSNQKMCPVPLVRESYSSASMRKKNGALMAFRGHRGEDDMAKCGGCKKKSASFKDHRPSEIHRMHGYVLRLKQRFV